MITYSILTSNKLKSISSFCDQVFIFAAICGTKVEPTNKNRNIVTIILTLKLVILLFVVNILLLN